MSEEHKDETNEQKKKHLHIPESDTVFEGSDEDLDLKQKKDKEQDEGIRYRSYKVSRRMGTKD